jgi:dihydroflavonol-4-reductase
MPPKLLETGASGFIGTHYILELLSHGYRVKGALRDLQRTEQIRAILRKHSERADGIEFVREELTDPSCREGALQGCDGVLHLASPVPVVQPKDADAIIRPAREGVLNVLEAAKKEMETSAAREVIGWQPRPPEEAIISGALSLIELGAVSL